MYKVGQRVKVIQIESTRWQHFNPDDKDHLLNKIFKIVDDLGKIGEEHAWRLETPFGVYNFVEFQFRALKKKGAIKTAKIPVVSLKGEVNWLDKVQGNFKNAGKIQTDLDDAIHNYRSSPGLSTREIFVPTRTQPIRGSNGIAYPVPRVVGYDGEEQQAPRAVTSQAWVSDEMQDEDSEEGNGN